MSIRKKIADAAQNAVVGKAERERQKAEQELQKLLDEAAEQRKRGDQK